MGRTCTVCRHQDRHAIEEAMLALSPYRDIASKANLSRMALVRHRKAHLPAHLAKAAEAESAHEAADLLADLRQLRLRVQKILDRADVPDGKVLAAVDRAVRIVEMLGKFRGVLAAGEAAAQVSVTNISITYAGAGWRGAVVEADAEVLEPQGLPGNGNGSE